MKTTKEKENTEEKNANRVLRNKLMNETNEQTNEFYETNGQKT